MKIENTVKIMKEIHSDRAIIVKVGQFYYCYGKDAIVLSYKYVSKNKIKRITKKAIISLAMTKIIW